MGRPAGAGPGLRPPAVGLATAAIFLPRLLGFSTLNRVEIDKRMACPWDNLNKNLQSGPQTLKKANEQRELTYVLSNLRREENPEALILSLPDESWNASYGTSPVLTL